MELRPLLRTFVAHACVGLLPVGVGAGVWQDGAVTGTAIGGVSTRDPCPRRPRSGSELSPVRATPSPVR